MSVDPENTVTPASGWIMTPSRDLLFLIATPLFIIPVVAWLASRRFTPEDIGLAVFAFASLGHHLPGFMRAYGDRELFARFRWRFILAPPLVLTVTWLAFAKWRLHGLELLVLGWATWHIMMQTYGFVRIYAMKSQNRNVAVGTAAWDFMACAAVFAAGFVFSDARVSGTVEVLWLCGVGYFGPVWLTALRVLVGVVSVLVISGWLVRSLQVGRQTRICWLKFGLLGSTAVLYWYAGQATVNLLIGVAMFEIYHAIQYFAIVWFYNRNQHRRSDSFGPLGFMFAGNWWGLPIYLLAIAAFGSLGFVARSGEVDIASQTAMAWFSASAILHFYYDGFIWKVREKQTGSNLELRAAATASASSRWTPALLWCLALALVISLGVIELTSRTNDEVDRLVALEQLTPHHPELLTRISQFAYLQGDADKAVSAASLAVARRPRSFTASIALGNAYRLAGNWPNAQQSYAAATQLRPDSVRAQFRLGQAALQAGQYDEAQRSLERCLKAQPDHIQARFQLGSVFFRTGRPDLAATEFRHCTQLDPDFADAYNNLGSSLYETGDIRNALQSWRTSLNINPNNALVHFNLGLLLIDEGDIESATRFLNRARELGHPDAQAVLDAIFR